MNIQIFGTKKCNDTKKAQRYFKGAHSPGDCGFARTGVNLNMFTGGNDCARLIAIKALLQRDL